MHDSSLYIHPLVTSVDVLELSLYIARDNPKAALEFIAEVEATFRLLSQHPEIGTRYHTSNRKLQGIRMIPVKRYPNYLIFYSPLPENNGAHVLYVLHGARDLHSVFKGDPRL